MSKKAGLIVNSFWMILTSMLSKLFGFFSISILSKIIAVKEFGFFQSFINSALYINQISDLGTTVVLQKNSAKYFLDEDSRVKFQNSLSIVFLIGLIANSFFVLMIYIYQNTFFESVLKIKDFNGFSSFFSVLIIVQFLLSIPTLILMNIGKFKDYSLVNTITSFLSFVITILGAYFFGIRGAIISYVVVTFINSIIFWTFFFKIIRNHGFTIKFFFSIGELKYVFTKGFIYYLGNTLLGAVVGLYTITLYVKYISIEEFGFLRIASSINAIITFLPASIIPIVFSYISLNSEEAVAKIKILQIKYISSIVFLLSIVIIFFLNNFILLFFKKDYLNSIHLVSQLLLINVVTISQTIFINFFIARTEGNKMGFVAILSLMLNILLLAVLLPTFKSNGYVIAFFSATIFSHTITVFFELKQNRTNKFLLNELGKFYLLFVPFFVSSFLCLFFFDESQMKKVLFIVFIAFISLFAKFLVTKDEIIYFKSKLILKK